MRRRLLAIVLTVVAVAGCSQGSATDTTLAPGFTTTTSVPGTTGGGDEAPSTTASPDGVTTSISDRPLAPDFTLELGDGGVYTLSDGAKPVYLVFWAEW